MNVNGRCLRAGKKLAIAYFKETVLAFAGGKKIMKTLSQDRLQTACL
jgi:hypothetical protein